jgi:hypothetical protein
MRSIRPGAPDWRARYYSKLFGSAGACAGACTAYLDGLHWVFRYYGGGFPPPDPPPAWFYPHHYAPTALDVLNCLDSGWSPPPDGGRHPRLQVSQAQLAAFVTPRSSGGAARHNEYLFPRRFAVTTYLKTKMWHCAPVLPFPADLERDVACD